MEGQDKLLSQILMNDSLNISFKMDSFKMMKSNSQTQYINDTGKVKKLHALGCHINFKDIMSKKYEYESIVQNMVTPIRCEVLIHSIK